MTKTIKNTIDATWPFEQRLDTINSFDGNLVHGASVFHARTKRSGAGRPASGGLIPEHGKVVIDTGKERYIKKENIWEEVDNCPVCNSVKREHFLSRYGLEVQRCLQCSHRYLSPRLKFSTALKVYSDDKPASDIYTSKIQIQIDKKKYSYGMDLIENLSPPSKERILDVGCGAGVFLETAFQRGWKQCIGVDINERYKTRYENINGVQYVMSPFEDLRQETVGNQYDCIAMWSVLEHIYDLSACISRIKSILKPNGLLFILVPNADSLATRIIREKSPTFAWKHVSYFNPKSLITLLEAHKMRCEHLETIISEIENIKSYLSGENPYGGFGDPQNYFSSITPEFIHKNLLGSRLIGIFRNE